MRAIDVAVFDGVWSRCASRGLAACAGAAAALAVASSPALGRYSGGSGGGSQQMSFEMLLANGSFIEGLNNPVAGAISVAVNNRGMYAINGIADTPTTQPEWFVLTDQGLAMGPNLANIPVDHDGQTAMAKLRSGLTFVDINNSGDLLTQAFPTNAIFGEFELPGLYVANRNGTVERVMSYEEPLPWWTGGESAFNFVGTTLKISDDDRVLVEGNASILGGTNITHISKFERDPNGTPSSGWLHTNVAAHGMPVAGGVYIGGDFRPTMGPDGRILLSSIASLPSPNGFGYTLFDDGVPVLQENQQSPVPEYFAVGPLSAQSAGPSGSFTTRFAVATEPAGDILGSVLYNSSRGVIWAGGEEVAATLGVPRLVSFMSRAFTDSRDSVFYHATLEMPSGEVLTGFWKNTELLIPLGMDIGDGRTITSFGSHFDVSDNGRWVVFIASLSDGTGGAMRVYVPAPGVAAILALSAPVLVGRRRRASRDLAKHL